jgi:hypothetical protein
MTDTRGRRPRGKAMYAEHQADPAAIRAEIGTHLRVEAIPGRKQLGAHGLLNPGSWTPENVETVIDEVLALAGFTIPYTNNPRRADVSGCSKAVQRTFDLYCADALGSIHAATLTRHRKELLRLGVDIGIPATEHQHLSASVGHRLHYSRRWKAPAALRNFMMSEATLPVLFDTVTQMLNRVRSENPPEKLALLEERRRLVAIPGKARVQLQSNA